MGCPIQPKPTPTPPQVIPTQLQVSRTLFQVNPKSRSKLPLILHLALQRSWMAHLKKYPEAKDVGQVSSCPTQYFPPCNLQPI